MTREWWAAMNARAGAACYYLALVDPDFDSVLIDEYAERPWAPPRRTAADRPRKHGPRPPACGGGTCERYGFPW